MPDRKWRHFISWFMLFAGIGIFVISFRFGLLFGMISATITILASIVCLCD